MASRLGLPLVPDTSYYYPRFYLGLPEGEKREPGEILSWDMCFDGRYYAVSGKCPVDREDFICYDVVTRTSLALGDRVTYEGRELLVSRKKTELAGGEVIFTYRLAGRSYTRVPWEANPDYTGMSFAGSIVGTQGEQVEVSFDIDKAAAGGNRYGFAPATGNLMYCMPQKGTKTAFYIGNGDEAQGIATGCIRTNGSTCEGTGSPEKKSFRSDHGKGMDLYPQSMGLAGGETGKITFGDETGTAIESSGRLVLVAKEGIRLESMTGIAVQGVSDIMALHGGGVSSLCINGSVDMLGRTSGICARTYRNYAPYDDAPEEGEFDWGGFARNLAIGLAVVAVCAVGAAISIATFGAGSILAGAMIGATIGAVSATVSGAAGDYSSGNVRSVEEAGRDLLISTASGFITGAVAAKFPGAHCFVEGAVDTGVSALGRLAYAAFDDSMPWEEKLAYAFDPGRMMADFVTGVVIGKAVKWLWGKLPFKGKGGDADAAGSGLKPDADDVAESALKGGSGTGEGGSGHRYSVDSAMFPDDEAAGVLRNGEYVKNPTAHNINDYISEGSNYLGSKNMNGQYMYVVDMDGNIIIGTRGGQRMPHPTLVGGKNPQVQAAGMIEIRGGKIYSINNASGHFKPSIESLEVAEDVFSNLPQNIFSKDFQGYLPYGE